MSSHRTDHRHTHRALLFGNFVIGLGVLMPAGLLNELNAAFAQDAATTQTLMAYGAALLCIEAPLLAFFTNRVDRRFLLTASLVVYALGHLVSAFADSFATLLVARLIMIGGAAAFTPQAASAISLLVPVDRRSTSVAFVFLGWPMASAVGIPVAKLMGAYVGWSSAYLIMGVACLLAAVWVAITVPAKLYAPRLSIRAWGKVVSNAKIIVILLVTMIFIAGQFSVYPYIAEQLKSVFEANDVTISMLFAVYGIAGAIGSIVSTRVIGGFGAANTVNAHLVVVLIGLFLWAISAGALWLGVLGLMAWGYGGGPAISGQQARLITADPDSGSASVALNTSVLYAGQALGTSIGGFLLVHDTASKMGWVAVALVTTALSISYWLERLHKRRTN